MKPEIQMQRELMKLALLILDTIEIAKDVFQDMGEDFMNAKIKSLQIRYAETMSKLAGELASIGNEDLKPETSY